MLLWRQCAKRALVGRQAWIAPRILSMIPMASTWIRPSTPARTLHTTRFQLGSTFQMADLSIDAYHRVSDHTLEHMVEYLEALGDDTDMDGYDVEYSQGVLTLKLGIHGTYVMNKQPPNKQIWLSSPKSGPKRYDYDASRKKWFYHRDDHCLDDLLNQELSEIFDRPIQVLQRLPEE